MQEEPLVDPNCISYWYPKIVGVVSTPKTAIMKTNVDLFELVDGKVPDGYTGFIERLLKMIPRVGNYPVFIRTGITSNKHDWRNSCYLTKPDDIKRHVWNLVEFSAIAEILGLPCFVWVVREMLPVTPIFHAFNGRMPIAQEFRLFVRDGKVEHTQPYWPPESIRNPSVDNWRELLDKISQINTDIISSIVGATERVGAIVKGYWSVDWLNTDKGWYLTDMAEGDRSYRWDPSIGAIR